MNKLVSIVVPCYNAENYIDACIDSLLNQTYRNCEIIIINDGSTDATAEKCKKYIADNINLINTKNNGVSVSRNIGISKATGKYILFVDSDDIVSNYYVEKLVYAIEHKDVDLVTCRYTNKINLLDSIEDIKYEKMILKKDEYLNHMINNNLRNGYLWNKIFKCEVINKYNLHFERNIGIWEDMYFVLQYLKKINNVYNIGNVLYYYRTRKNSTVNRKDTLKSLTDKRNILELILKDKKIYLNDNNWFKIKKLHITITLKYLVMVDSKQEAKVQMKNIKEEKNHIRIGLKNKFKYYVIKFRNLL